MLGQGGWKDGAPKASEKFHNRLEDTLCMIEKQQTEKRDAGKVRKTDWIRKIAAGCTGLAAAAAVFMGICYQNPVWAAELPVIGHIFEKMEEKLSFGENYENYVEPVDNPQKTEEKNETKQVKDEENAEETAEGYSQTADGITITLSESYYSGNALYLSMIMKSEEPFTETFKDEWGISHVSICTKEMYSFAQEIYPGYMHLEGDFLDSHTYAGVARLDMPERLRSVRDESKVENGITEDFTLDFTVSQIIGDLAEPEKLDTGYSPEELEAMSDEEWNAVMVEAYGKDADWGLYPNKHENWWIDGAWTFHLEIDADKIQKQIAEVDMVDENGAGILSVEKTPFELVVNEVYGNGNSEYFPVMLDAQGKYMEGIGDVDTIPVKGHDISTVYVYLCDFDEYMDRKGERITNPDGFKELMDEMAVMKTEVHFE